MKKGDEGTPSNKCSFTSRFMMITSEVYVQFVMNNVQSNFDLRNIPIEYDIITHSEYAYVHFTDYITSRALTNEVFRRSQTMRSCIALSFDVERLA